MMLRRTLDNSPRPSITHYHSPKWFVHFSKICNCHQALLCRLQAERAAEVMRDSKLDTRIAVHLAVAQVNIIPLSSSSSSSSSYIYYYHPHCHCYHHQNRHQNDCHNRHCQPGTRGATSEAWEKAGIFGEYSKHCIIIMMNYNNINNELKKS